MNAAEIQTMIRSSGPPVYTYPLDRTSNVPDRMLYPNMPRPKVKAVEYHEDGTIKRIEYFE